MRCQPASKIDMRPAPIHLRFAWAAALALLLALRSLAPAGFMPAFDNGALTIVACPDYAPAQRHHHHSGDRKVLHQPCPYAAASALVAVGADWAPLFAATLFAAVLLLGRSFIFIQRHSRRERPPPIGPPLLPA